MQKTDNEPLSYTMYKNQSKWIINLKEILKIIRFLEENMDRKVDVSLANGILDMTIEHRQQKLKYTNRTALK